METLTPDLQRYTYEAHLVRVVDGDTVHFRVDLGFTITREDVDVRLWGINAPELHGDQKDAGVASKHAVRQALTGADLIVIQTIKDKDGKYGRLLAKVWYLKDGDWHYLNRDLVAQGFAAIYPEGAKL